MKVVCSLLLLYSKKSHSFIIFLPRIKWCLKKKKKKNEVKKFPVRSFHVPYVNLWNRIFAKKPIFHREGSTSSTVMPSNTESSTGGEILQHSLMGREPKFKVQIKGSIIKREENILSLLHRVSQIPHAIDLKIVQVF